MRRIFFPAVVLVVLLVSCEGQSPASAPSISAPSSSSEAATADPTDTVSPAVAPSASSAAGSLPDGVPTTFGEDVPARELPGDELIPPGDELTGVRRARTDGGDAVVLLFATPGSDPFAQARGFVVWRRDEGADPPWRAVYGLAHRKRDGVLAISADATDLTGDGSDDALVREETGGTGACATYRVIDLAVGAPIWKRSVCDAEVQPSPDPLGLYVVARVYEPEDPHCCPSAISERVLTWNGDRFVVVSEELTPL